MAEKIKRFRLKPDADLSIYPKHSYWSFVCDKAMRGFNATLYDSISLNVAFPEDFSSWDDYNYVLVLDEDHCQPYMPFYHYMDDPDKEPFPVLEKVVIAYNEIMSKVECLEEIHDFN